MEGYTFIWKNLLTIFKKPLLCRCLTLPSQLHEFRLRKKVLDTLVAHFENTIKGKISTMSLYDVFNLDHNRSEGDECHDGFIIWDSESLAERQNCHRMANAYKSWQFGISIVVDMWYNQAHHKLSTIISSLTDVLHTNMESTEPFFIHFTDITLDSQSGEAVKHLLQANEDYLQAFHTKSCVDIFPKSKLIYLTPYTIRSIKPDESLKFESAVYVIGGLLDGPYNRMSAKRVQQLGVTARCFYKTHSKETQHGNILSMARSLVLLNKLQMGNSFPNSAKLFIQWANVTKRQHNNALEPFYQSLFEY